MPPPADFRTYILRLLHPDGSTAGTGFLVSADGLIATCSHVVLPFEAQQVGKPRPKTVRLVFHTTGQEALARVVSKWWRGCDAEDVAILRLEGELPDGVQPLQLASYADSGVEQPFRTFGFPDLNSEGGLPGGGEIVGDTELHGLPVLMLRSQEVTPGFSGAPVWDAARDCALGMVCQIAREDEYGRLGASAFALRSEVLTQICPELKLAGLSHAQREQTLKRLLRALSSKPAKVVYYASALGALALIPGVPLPPELQVIAAGVGVNALSSILERVALGQKVSDQEIVRQVEIAVKESDLDGLLTSDEFNRKLARLVRQQRLAQYAYQAGLDKLGQQIENQLDRVEGKIDGVKQDTEEIKQDTKRLLELVEQLAIPTFSLAPFQAPPLPEYYVPRPEYSERLLEMLLAPAPNQPGALVVSAVQGLGGIGKTTLVAEIGRDPQVRGRFPDGVLWATLGQQPELLSLLHSWIRALGEHKYSPLTIDDASRHLSTMLEGKACLLVVDDAWQAEYVRLFLVGSSGCQVLITTRDATLALKVHARLFDLDVMTEAQALALFEARLGKLGAERDAALVLARELGCLPLALELAAAQVEDGQSWKKLLSAFQKGLADLDALSLDEAAYRNESLRISFKLSLDQLTEAEQDAFCWLGVLPEDAQLNPQMASILWKMPVEDAGKRLKRFRGKALLKSLGEEQYTVHDLLHDEAGLRLAKQIPVPQAHASLLERYQALCTALPNGEKAWHTLPDDSYIHAHLTWHMQQAGQAETIYALLAEETAEGRNGWYQTCERSGQLAIFLDDLNRAWDCARETNLDDAQIGRNLAIEIRLAFCHASLVSQSANYPPELLALAVENHLMAPAHALALAEQNPEPGRKIQSLYTLAPHLPTDLRTIALASALQAAQAIGRESYRADALSDLAPQLPNWAAQYPGEALDAWRSLIRARAKYPRSDLLGKIGRIVPFAIAFLPEDQKDTFLTGVLEAIQSTTRWWP